MPRRKTPLDVVMDLVVFAPVGFWLGLREVIPELAERGRRQVDTQIRLVRLVGDLVTQQARAAAGRVDDHAPARDRLGVDRVVSTTAREEVIPVRLHGVDGSPAESAGLAIPDYDSLAASQVVPRLAGLTAEELDAVRRYEQAHRGRATVLGRIAQLQAG